MQLELTDVTAANPDGTTEREGAGQTAFGRPAVPKAAVNEENSSPAMMMEEVTIRLTRALSKVAANKGAPGPDRETVEALRERWSTAEPALRTALLEGRYRPGDIRRVLIPKAGGGQRGLGIPNVVDRVVQEAIRQVLEPLYEPTFHASSHGFRPGRSCHTAIAAARQNLEAGYTWVVDLDLEKFFDRVNHQRLMARLALRVDDRRLLVLLGQMLKAGVVLPDGVLTSTEEGVPQGGPLSPLLSNIVLDEFDHELDRRGHRFVRYADDANIFVRSERAGQRVMASIARFLEERMRLRINAEKSAVGRPEERNFLGFSLRVVPEDGTVEVLLSERTKRRVMERVRALTPRQWGNSIDCCIARINVYLRGWYGFFGICDAREKYSLQGIDARIRRRLRAIILTHWKRKRSIVRQLIKLGAKPNAAWAGVYRGRRSTWKLSHIPVVDLALRRRYFASLGLTSLVSLHKAPPRKRKRKRKPKPIVAPGQLTLDWG